MSKFWKNTGAEGKMCVNSIQVTPSVQGALQKVSYLFPVGESDVSFTINKSSDGTVKICRGAFSDAKNPLAHGGPGPTIPKYRIVQIMHDIMDGDAGVCDTSIEKVAEAISRHAKAEEPLPVLADRKGYAVYTNKRGHQFRSDVRWHISLTYIKGSNTREHFYFDTYAECEAKARAYLEGLDDKGEKR